MIVQLPYGNKIINLNLKKNEVGQVIRPGNIKCCSNLKKEILKSLNFPVGCERIKEIVIEKSKEKDKNTENLNVAIICDDNTRLTPADKILPVLINKLNKAGIKNNKIKIIIALGTHRNMTDEEIVDKVGIDIFNNIKVINHSYANNSKLINLGFTENGTPISINKCVYKSDIAIGIGSIVPHHIPGFSGGAKIVQPGVSGEETTAFTHLLSVRNKRYFLGIVENIVREEMEDIARKVGVDYIFNVVLNRNGGVYKTFFGDIVLAFREGVKASKEIYQINVNKKTNVVIAGSHPCDIEFWQAHKSLYPADMIVRENGIIIIVTPCYEGVSKTHKDMLNFTNLSYNEIDNQLKKGAIKDKVAAALAMAWARIKEHVDVILVSSGISKQKAELMGFYYADSVGDAVKLARNRFKEKIKINILTHAPDILPNI